MKTSAAVRFYAGPWGLLLAVVILLWWLLGDKRETIPTWGDSSNTG